MRFDDQPDFAAYLEPEFMLGLRCDCRSERNTAIDNGMDFVTDSLDCAQRALKNISGRDSFGFDVAQQDISGPYGNSSDTVFNIAERHIKPTPAQIACHCPAFFGLVDNPTAINILHP